MKLKDFELLKKFMGSAMSEQDGEALNALRMANRILQKENLTWAKVLDRSLKVEYDIEEAPPHRDVSDRSAEIEEAFSFLARQDLPESTENFIHSLSEQWTKRRSLSQAQREALFKVYNRNAR